MLRMLALILCLRSFSVQQATTPLFHIQNNSLSFIFIGNSKKSYK